MAREARRVRVPPGSELGPLLKEAATEPLLLEADGELYRLERVVENVWRRYDAERALAGIRAAAGSWSDVDLEQVKLLIYRAREEGTRPHRAR